MGKRPHPGDPRTARGPPHRGRPPAGGQPDLVGAPAAARCLTWILRRQPGGGVRIAFPSTASTNVREGSEIGVGIPGYAEATGKELRAR